jgi:16S rRNA (adenine1518-N6/adenine1519-N6)-dimethyltransferase
MVSPPRRGARQRSLGQNFLVDRNILDVIERLASLSAHDVVLEIGGGAGVLSERLAATAGFVHVVEVDPRLEEGLRSVLAPFANASLVVADALSVNLAALSPAPTKVVANLPYGVAATVILRTVFDLPLVSEWVVMVQREVGERLAAAPGTPAYGVPSVLAQLSCSVQVLRPVSRSVFRPIPNVDSVLVGLTRSPSPAPGATDPAVRALVRDGFAHRRKALARSLALAPGAAPDVRDRARAALTELGLPPDVRAERLSPAEFVALASRLSR